MKSRMTTSYKRRQRRKRATQRFLQVAAMKESACQTKRSEILSQLASLVTSGQGQRTPSCYDTDGGGEWSARRVFHCDFHEQVHTLEAIYVRNLRDVNLLAFYEDDQKISYTMM